MGNPFILSFYSFVVKKFNYKKLANISEQSLCQFASLWCQLELFEINKLNKNRIMISVISVNIILQLPMGK